MEKVKRGKGHPRAFKTAEEFENKFMEYISYCRMYERVPNVAGFVVYANINSDTFYAQKDYYSETFKRVNSILEDEAINTDYFKDAFKIFYMKNKFGWKDKSEIDNNIANKDGTPFKADFSHLTIEQIKELLRNEDKE